MTGNSQNKDILSSTRILLQKPSRNTKRKILVSVNVTFIFLTILHIIIQLLQFGKLPDPVRDMIFYPILFLINSISAYYNIRILLKENDGTKFWNGFTAWSSMVILMLLAISIVHTNINTALSLLFDFSLSVIVIFISGTVLNRKVAIVWFVISMVSIFIAYQNRGAEYKYHLMTQEEVTLFEKLLEEKDPDALERMDIVKQEKIEPISIKLFYSIWLIFLLLAFLPTYFESAMLGNILRIIPTVIDNIQIAAEEKNTLQNENLRMGTELDVAKRIQTIVLPVKEELDRCKELEIAAIMETATEVGGDFYEVLPQSDGSTCICIGDVTGHGLQSGVVMLMTQSALRAILDETGVSLTSALNHLNTILYRNIRSRMNDERNLTLSLLRYENNKINLAGQHESVLHIKKNEEKITEISTNDFGIYIGLIEDVSPHIKETSFDFNKEDIIVLYSDGVTEAEDVEGNFYGIDRLKKVIEDKRNESVESIIKHVQEDIYQFIGRKQLLDDISLVVIKHT